MPAVPGKLGRGKISDAGRAASPLGTRDVLSTELLRSAPHIFLNKTTFATGCSAVESPLKQQGADNPVHSESVLYHIYFSLKRSLTHGYSSLLTLY